MTHDAWCANLIQHKRVETMNTKTEAHFAPSTDGPTETVTDDCTGGSCPLSVCSPCLIIWGLAGMFFIIAALLQVFS